MIELSYLQAAEQLRLDMNLNCIAFARTPWHAAGINAALHMLAEKHGAIHALVLMQYKDESRSSTLLDAADFPSDGQVHIRVCLDAGPSFPASKKALLQYKRAYYAYYLQKHAYTRTVFVLNPMSPARHFLPQAFAALPTFRFVSVITDEGLGTYMRSPMHWAVEKFMAERSIKSFIRSLATNLPNRLCDRRLEKKDEYLYFGLLLQKGRHIAANEQAIPYYKAALSGQTVDSRLLEAYRDAVLINLQLYHRTGQIGQDADLALLHKLCAKLQANGIPVVIKPHPRETDLQRYRDLPAYVEQNTAVAQEVILAALDKKPRAVISFTSTSLITAQLLYHVQAISLNRLLPKACVSPSLRSEFAKFHRVFSRWAAMPARETELWELLGIVDTE